MRAERTETPAIVPTESVTGFSRRRLNTGQTHQRQKERSTRPLQTILPRQLVAYTAAPGTSGRPRRRPHCRADQSLTVNNSEPWGFEGVSAVPAALAVPGPFLAAQPRKTMKATSP